MIGYQASAEGTAIRAVFVRRKDFAAARLRYTVNFSADLASWSDSMAESDVIASSGEVELVSVPYPASIPGGVPRFFRVAVTANH